jgi:multidrug efflux pump subunit AcrA (membrane-fusion protein)
MVHQGDALATIDPRPYQAQLTQTQGQYQRDRALLEKGPWKRPMLTQVAEGSPSEGCD